MTLVSESQTWARRSNSCQRLVALKAGFDDEKIGRHLTLIMLDRRGKSAQLHRQMRLGQTAVAARALQGSSRIGKFAEGVDRNARHGAFVRSRTEHFFAVALVFIRRHYHHPLCY